MQQPAPNISTRESSAPALAHTTAAALRSVQPYRCARAEILPFIVEGGLSWHR
jgi:hypothetical protein